MELNVNQLKKYYGDIHAVDGISYTFTPGVYGLLGANGAGKTTFIRMLCGILKPASGDITFDGTQVSQESYRASLGYLPQDFGYYPDFTAMDFMLYMGCVKGYTKQIAKAKAKELLAIVSLQDVAQKKVKTFSGGMKQRLGIAQAMINNPKILILDEPTAGLDPKERVRFRNLISQLGNDRIVLLSTHIVSDIEHIAKEVLLMKDGTFIHTGSARSIQKVVDGKIFECEVSPKKAEELSASYTTINVRDQNNQVFLRIAADQKPCEEATPVPATLEDLYLYYFSD